MLKNYQIISKKATRGAALGFVRDDGRPRGKLDQDMQNSQSQLLTINVDKMKASTVMKIDDMKKKMGKD